MESLMPKDDRSTRIDSALRKELAARVPGWTDHNAHDPGVTLLELVAYALETTAYRTPSEMGPTHRATVGRLVKAVAELQRRTADGAPSQQGVRRVNYFSGQMLGVEDLKAEQDYFRGRLRRLNLAAHGVGVVSGLKISLTDKGQAVLIQPGLAVDGVGEEIEVPEIVSVPLPANATVLVVQLRFAETLCEPVPALEGSSDANPLQYSRMIETGEVVVSPAAVTGAVVLGRLRRKKGRWSLAR
jgi:hypothetical protein